MQNLEDGFWVCVDVWGELNVYIHMYATLAMGGNQQSHKQIDESRPWVMRMYYSNAYVLFLVCTLNVLFFIASYLLSSSSPTLMPSLSEVSQATRPWIGAMEMARQVACTG